MARSMSKRNSAIDATLTLPGITLPVGRPRKPGAFNNAQRQARFRARVRLSMCEAESNICGESISVTRNGNSD